MKTGMTVTRAVTLALLALVSAHSYAYDSTKMCGSGAPLTGAAPLGILAGGVICSTAEKSALNFIDVSVEMQARDGNFDSINAPRDLAAGRDVSADRDITAGGTLYTDDIKDNGGNLQMTTTRSALLSGTGGTTVKGGTHSGTLNLNDGDAEGGSNLTISGSEGGTAATVFQTTTDAGTTSVTTAVGTNATYANGSTATLQAGPNNAVTVNSGNAGSQPGVSINGVVGAGSSSHTGVLVTGSGQNGNPYTDEDRAAGTVPNWADVAIQSLNYGKGDPTLGSAILVTDYGIQILSPQPVAGQKITNDTGINTSSGQIENNLGGNTSSGSVINNYGFNTGSGSVVNNSGSNSSSGSVANNTGNNTGTGSVANTSGDNSSSGSVANRNGNNTGTGTVTNTSGDNSSSGSVANRNGNNDGTGTVTNTSGGNTSSGSVANNNGNNSGSGDVTNISGSNSGEGDVSNSIGYNTGSGITTNSFGAGTGVSINTMGNTNPETTIGLTAANSETIIQNGINTSSINGGADPRGTNGTGGSVFLDALQGTSSLSGAVLRGASTPHAVVDSNGKITTTTGPVEQSTAMVTVTNGYGNTHGLVVNEQVSTLSGGSYSSSLTLGNNGATFSNSRTGRPIQVHGVADGTLGNDAVNVRQLNAVKMGIAGTAAMSNIPALEANKHFNVGVGVGGFDGENAFAVGASARISDNLTTRASFSHAMSSNGSNVDDTSWGLGAAYSW